MSAHTTTTTNSLNDRNTREMTMNTAWKMGLCGMLAALTVGACKGTDDVTGANVNVGTGGTTGGDTGGGTGGGTGNVTPTPVTPPEGVVGAQGAGSPMFAMDKTEVRFTIDVFGAGDWKLEGILADDVGRREIRLANASTGGSEVVAKADWNLPPAGAVGQGGAMLICYGRLMGPVDPKSTATDGTMPTPAHGAGLFCRTRKDATLGAEVRIAKSATAAWLQDVVALPNGSFRVTYLRDAGWIVGPAAEGHGVYEEVFDGATWGAPNLVKANAFPEATPGT